MQDLERRMAVTTSAASSIECTMHDRPAFPPVVALSETLAFEFGDPIRKSSESVLTGRAARAPCLP